MRVGFFERTASKHVYYQGWNRSPAQVGCMRQLLRDGALGRPRGMGWGGRWEGGSGWGTHVNPWLIHINVWQKPLQYFKVISLQVIKINEKKKKSACHLWQWQAQCGPPASSTPHLTVVFAFSVLAFPMAPLSNWAQIRGSCPLTSEWKLDT